MSLPKAPKQTTPTCGPSFRKEPSTPRAGAWLGLCAFAGAWVLGIAFPGAALASSTRVNLSGPDRACYNCHAVMIPVEAQRYLQSAHYRAGIGCTRCHGTTGHETRLELGYRYRLQTQGADGTTLMGSGAERTYFEPRTQMIVQAERACQDCHAAQYKEWVGRNRKPNNMAEAATPYHGVLRFDMGISSWYDTFMAVFGLVERDSFGEEMFRVGCVRCHDQTQEWNLVRVLGPVQKGKMNVATVGPSTGVQAQTIAAALPDLMSHQAKAIPEYGNGSLLLGKCVYCHPRHGFEAKAAIRPEACAKCHMGPDHPQYESYQTSTHGFVYLEQGGWPRGHGPTCTTCHQSRKAPDGHTIHDETPGMAWNYKSGTAAFREERATMIERCELCHSSNRATQALAEADTVARTVTQTLMNELQGLLNRAYDLGLMKPPDNPFFGKQVRMQPTFAHAFPWGAGTRSASPLERLFWDAWREYGLWSQETGAWHFNPGFAHWMGLKPATARIAEFRERIQQAEAARK